MTSSQLWAPARGLRAPLRISQPQLGERVSRDIEPIDVMLYTLCSDEITFSKAVAFRRLIHQFIFMRRLFVMPEKKYLGLGSDSLQIGDEVWFLPRTNTPVVLRKLPNGHFMVIGAAYVPGLMKGEAIDGRLDTLEDIKYNWTEGYSASEVRW